MLGNAASCTEKTAGRRGEERRTSGKVGLRGLGQNNQISSGSKIGNNHHHHNQLLGFKGAVVSVGGPGGGAV